MNRGSYFRNDYAISEIVGGIILVLIAIIAFTVISTQLYPPPPDDEINVTIEGNVNESGYVLLEHMGGSSLNSFTISAGYPNGTNKISKSFNERNWDFGEIIYLQKEISDLSDIRLLNEKDRLEVSIHCKGDDNVQRTIFSGVIKGRIPEGPPNIDLEKPENNSDEVSVDISELKVYINDPNGDYFDWNISTTPNIGISSGFEEKNGYKICNITGLEEGETYFWTVNAVDRNDSGITNTETFKFTVESNNSTTGNPMLISSLKTNTVDEDLIGYNHKVNASFTPTSYIYNWFKDSKPISNILLAFDKNDTNTIKDFSTKGNDATNNGCSWINNGIVGGCYQFNGNDYTTIPYCFSNDGYADDLTIEFWIKTSQNNVFLTSYLENNMFSIKIVDGVIQWDTISDGDLDETTGNTIVNDDQWHHIAVSYDSTEGVSKIYVDGFLDSTKNSHNPGDRLGEGTTNQGSIGKKDSSSSTDATWDVLTYDDFESGWGNYQDGGWDCSLYTGGTYSHQGSNSANVDDDSGQYSSFYHSSGIDVDTPEYTSIKIDFWFYAYSMEEREDFFVNYYDGSDWIRIGDYDSGDEFENYQFQHEIIWINETDYNFPNNMRLQFQCDASSDYDDVFFDQIYVNATVGGEEMNNYSGLIDEFNIYNKTLSGEQIYQNYLCKKNGLTNQSVIVSDETNINDVWNFRVTPVCETQIGEYVKSNSIVIEEYGGI